LRKTYDWISDQMGMAAYLSPAHKEPVDTSRSLAVGG